MYLYPVDLGRVGEAALGISFTYTNIPTLSNKNVPCLACHGKRTAPRLATVASRRRALSASAPVGPRRSPRSEGVSGDGAASGPQAPKLGRESEPEVLRLLYKHKETGVGGFFGTSPHAFLKQVNQVILRHTSAG